MTHDTLLSGRLVRAVTALGVAAGVAAAGPAQAQAQELRMGGGAEITENSAPVMVSVARGPESVRWTVDTAVVCKGVPGVFTVDVFGTAPLKGDFFQATKLQRISEDGATFRAAVQLQGTFAADRAQGKVRVAGELRRPGRRTVVCTPGSVARTWQARSLQEPVGRPVPPQPAGSAYGLGTATLRRGILLPVQVQTTTDGSSVALLFAARVQCDRSPDVPVVNISRPAAVAADGRFRRVERFSLRLGRLRGLVTVSSAGRFRDGGIGGGLRLRLRIVDGQARTVDRCDTGLVRWAARP